MNAPTRVIINSIAQYVRTIVNVLISLFTVRIVLEILGVDDYGIYNLVAGAIAMLSFITTAMAISIQRFLSFAQGENDIEKHRKIFCNSFNLNILLGIGAVLLAEMFGIFLFDGIIIIPPDRIWAARIVYHFVCLNVFFSIVSSTFKALLISKENIVFVSIVEIIEPVFKLGIALSLSCINQDRLIYWSMLLCVMTVVTLLLYFIYCYRKYRNEITINIKSFDINYSKKLFSFIGWTLYSSGCIALRTQGIAILLNRIFGVVINAAYGIAAQVSGQFSFLSSSMTRATNPIIVKMEGANNRQKMLRTSEITSKFGFFLLAIVAIPAIFETHTIFNLWLTEVPEYTVLICRFILISMLFDLLTSGLGQANQAIGDIKAYSLTINTLKLLTVPIVWIMLKFDTNVSAIFSVYAMIELLSALSRLVYLRKSGGLSIFGFVQRVFMKEILPIFFFVISCIFIIQLNAPSTGRLMMILIFPNIVFILSIYFYGLCPDEKSIVIYMLTKLKKKFL